MKLIPEEWSIGLISQFLSGSLRLSLHKSRTTKMLSSLARGENIKVSDKNSCLGQIPRAFVDSYPIIPSTAAYITPGLIHLVTGIRGRGLYPRGLTTGIELTGAKA